MITSINKDTKIYCSFSKNAGNKGCEFFNQAFLKYNINAIYKSFSINDIDSALKCAKILKFSGCGISMPFKINAFDLVDKKDASAIKCKSINTILFDENSNKLIGYNTDFYATQKILRNYLEYETLYILGNGGLSLAVKAQAEDMGFDIITITRKEWDIINTLKNSLIINCTPLSNITSDQSNIFIDCTIGSYTGNLFHKYQSEKQFEIYTGIKYEL
jgi:shikimate 5-dehydrogenase